MKGSRRGLRSFQSVALFILMATVLPNVGYASDSVRLRESMNIPLAIGGYAPDRTFHFFSMPGEGKVITTKNGIVITSKEGPQFVGYPIRAIITQRAKVELSSQLDIWRDVGGEKPVTYLIKDGKGMEVRVSDLAARFTSTEVENAGSIDVLLAISVDPSDASKLLISINDKEGKPLGWQGYIILPKDSATDVVADLTRK